MASLRDTVKDYQDELKGRYRMGGVLETGAFMERGIFSS